MQRTIKSFVLRAGRVSNRQQYALDNWLENVQLPIIDDHWNFSSIFNRQAETILEIGFGMGASLFTMAQQYPDINFIGIEVHRAGLGSLSADLHDNNISNVRLAAGDAVEIIKSCIAPGSLSGVQIFFPDPWHKKRHNKRRLIQKEFIQCLSDRLKPGGFIHCATDWQDYAEQMLAVLSNEVSLTNSQKNDAFSPRPSTRPLTKFEKRGTKLGHGVWDLIFYKLGNDCPPFNISSI